MYLTKMEREKNKNSIKWHNKEDDLLQLGGEKGEKKNSCEETSTESFLW